MSFLTSPAECSHPDDLRQALLGPNDAKWQGNLIVVCLGCGEHEAVTLPEVVACDQCGDTEATPLIKGRCDACRHAQTQWSDGKVTA